ncbi:hypothetical protein RS130_14810 [Paraglaciecola aquimarina]|uniref:Gylcosyl hydrolase 115 C-terminal domain-containing protein n=1 Tax=Paraglaciecola aquimarina TaxID=1235557 RepID=A0ABU3SYA7_9ALTE|nr:hypothetical protein [Paraglaciecola aquimarina]MDU0355004.1 hypothetical protein [Paraglaciecola aquimarina]
MKLTSLSLIGLSVLASSCANTVNTSDTATSLVHSHPVVKRQNYIEKDGLVVIEAENFATQVLSDKRRWLVFNDSDGVNAKGVFADPDLPHTHGASGNSYIEILPDNRTNHDEELIHGENFSPDAGKMAVVTYPVYFSQPGRYIIWGRAFSTGPEDNGFHFGLDGVWQESSQRLQFCDGKHMWTWSSQQRVDSNHCGTPKTLWVDVVEAGQHTLMMSMREDGAELDKIILSNDLHYTPSGVGPEETLYKEVKLAEKKAYIDIDHYAYILNSSTSFDFESTSADRYYYDKWRGVLAINAGNPALRNKFISAQYTHNKAKPESFKMKLVTLTELDGESEYRVLLNGKLLGEFKNPETKIDYQEAVFDVGMVELKKGDVITVQSNAVTNGKIPEGDITAFARGRWRGLVLQQVN